MKSNIVPPPAKMAQPVTPNARVLEGWKAIAHYLGRGVRTVQRYERDLRLPVRHLPKKDSESVVANAVELDRWVLTSPTRSLARTQLETQLITDLRSGILELRRLCAESRDLREEIRAQRTALRSSVTRTIDFLSNPDPSVKTERHKAIASEQSTLAREMIQSARQMSDRAVGMRKPRSHARVIYC